MITDQSTELCELTPEQLETVSGGVLGVLAFAAGWAWSMGTFGQDTTTTNVTNAMKALLNG